MKLSVFALLAAGAAGLIGSSAALADEGLATKRVTYSDINIATDAGIEHLYARLRKAAEDVCGAPSIKEVKAFALARECAARSLDAAVAAVNSPKLTARHQLGSSAARVAAL